MPARNRLRAYANAVAAAILTAPIATAAALAGVTIEQKVKYYDVRGKTPEALDKSIGRNAPLLNGKDRAIGLARLKFDPKIQFRETERGCEVADADVKLDVVTTLPRWRDEKRAKPELRLVWQIFFSLVEAHERTHADIAMKHARQLQRVFTRVPRAPNCKLLQARLLAGAKRILTAHHRAQANFDKRDRTRFDRNMRNAIRKLQVSSAN